MDRTPLRDGIGDAPGPTEAGPAGAEDGCFVERRGGYRIPSEDALIAFESTARLGSFSHAARELGTTRTTVSRLVAGLERQLSARLLERSWVGLIPTRSGKRLYDAVAAGLEIIQTAAVEADAPHDGEEVVIACSHEAHRFFVMPRYDALVEVLGARGRLRVANRRSAPAGADLVLAWERDIGAEDHAVIFAEAVRPVCSPDYAEDHAGPVRGPAAGWGGLALLDFAPAAGGLASWEDWFRAAGRPDRRPRFVRVDGYAQALGAAAEGRGIALGWRHLIERHLETGVLVALGDGYVERDNRYCARLTERGRGRALARRCLAFFAGCA